MVVPDVEAGVIERAELHCLAVDFQRSEVVVDWSFDFRDRYLQLPQVVWKKFELNIMENFVVVLAALKKVAEETESAEMVGDALDWYGGTS